MYFFQQVGCCYIYSSNIHKAVIIWSSMRSFEDRKAFQSLFKENCFSSATPRHCAESKQVFANRRRWISCQLYWPLRYTFKSTCVFHVGGQIRWDYLAIKMFKCYRNVSWRPKPLHSGLKLILKDNSCFHVHRG